MIILQSLVDMRRPHSLRKDFSDVFSSKEESKLNTRDANFSYLYLSVSDVLRRRGVMVFCDLVKGVAAPTTHF